MTLRIASLLLAFILAGCTHDFDQFREKRDGGSDGSTSSKLTPEGNDVDLAEPEAIEER